MNLDWQAIAEKLVSSESIEGEIIKEQYQIIEQLGAGESWETYLAKNLYLPNNSQCVVKRLKSDASETAKALFDREAKILSNLGKHDRIPYLLAYFGENEYFFLVHEFIDGESLSQEWVEGEPWRQDRVISLLREILEILVFVHGGNIVHRDINWENLMRRKGDRQLVLTNFGAVKQVTAGSQTISIAGTPGYMPPEQTYGIARLSSDVYAVGVMGIQALTGLKPGNFRANIDTGNLEWRSKAEVLVSRELGEVLDRMVRYDFKERYQSAKEAWSAICSI
ncbi:MAG: serine/threonine protein kinase [Okeania sp. SIO2H7]|nr:serine/threonine protein kinase [Okeania sp. SIO2H7]